MSPLNHLNAGHMCKTAVISPATDASGFSYPALLFLYLFYLLPSKVPCNLLMYDVYHLLSVSPCKRTYSQGGYLFADIVQILMTFSGTSVDAQLVSTN